MGPRTRGVRTDASWLEHAVCRPVDQPMFSSTDTTSVAVALHMCHDHCTVRADCKKWALDLQLSDIVCGGAWFGALREGRIAEKHLPPIPTASRRCRLCTAADIR